MTIATILSPSRSNSRFSSYTIRFYRLDPDSFYSAVRWGISRKCSSWKFSSRMLRSSLIDSDLSGKRFWFKAGLKSESSKRNSFLVASIGSVWQFRNLLLASFTLNTWYVSLYCCSNSHGLRESFVSSISEQEFDLS